MGWLVDADKHSIDSPDRRHAKGHADMTARPCGAVVRDWSCDRKVCSNDDVLSLQMTVTGLNPPTVARTDLVHSGVLENASSGFSNGYPKADEILHRIELSLILESQCTGSFKRQRRPG